MASTNRMTEAQQMAQTLGIVIGAASCCEQVTEERVNSVAVKLRELVSATADDRADAHAPMSSSLLRSKPARQRSRAGGSIPNMQRPR